MYTYYTKKKEKIKQKPKKTKLQLFFSFPKRNHELSRKRIGFAYYRYGPFFFSLSQKSLYLSFFPNSLDPKIPRSHDMSLSFLTPDSVRIPNYPNPPGVKRGFGSLIQRD